MTKTKKDASINMLEGKILPSIIKYTIPIMLTSILQVLFNAADLVVVGRYCGSLSVASVGATSAITMLIVNLFSGLSVGAGVSVAHAKGCDNKAAVHRLVHTSIPAAVISGLILTLIGVLFSNVFLGLMGTPDNLIPLSSLYMKIYFCGMTFTMLYNFGASILRAVGDTKSPLIYLSLSGVLNVLLNVIFVTVLKMDVAGVALATYISQAISGVLVFITLMHRTDECVFNFSQMKIYKDELMRIIKIGLPAGLQGALFAISNVIIQSSINSFGDVFLSGSAAAANLESFVAVSIYAFHHTSVNFIGQNMGAKNFKRIKKVFWACIFGATITGIVLGVTFYLFGNKLLGIYITDSDEAIKAGMIRLLFITLPYFLYGIVEVTTGALRGLGSSLAPMVISVVGICGIRIVWIYTIFQIPNFHNPYIMFTSYPISWIVTFALQFAAFMVLYNRLKNSSPNQRN